MLQHRSKHLTLRVENMESKTVRDYLFSDPMFHGCSNHGCVVKKRVGMGTNGMCSCLLNFNRVQLRVLQSRLAGIIDKIVVEPSKGVEP